MAAVTPSADVATADILDALNSGRRSHRPKADIVECHEDVGLSAVEAAVMASDSSKLSLDVAAPISRFGILRHSQHRVAFGGLF